MSSTNIKQLLQQNTIWQASQKIANYPTATTGYPLLDRQLHYRGWPQGALSEILIAQHGVGEIRLLSPLLARLSQRAGYILWINPPYQPYAPALAQQGLCLEQLIIVKTDSLAHSIWAGQQAMASNACAAVLLWLPDKTLNNEIRKLSLAAKSGNCWGVILRSQKLQQHPCAAVLRITMQIQQGQHQLNIIKQPGGWSGQQVNLNLFPEKVNWTALSAQHWPVFTPIEKHSAENNSSKDIPICATKVRSTATNSVALANAYH